MAFKKLKYWFDKELAILLAEKITTYKSDFNSKGFINIIHISTTEMELKDRVEFIADQFQKHLGTDYQKNIILLSKILGPENTEETGMFTNFYWIMPIAKYVEKYGLDNFDISMTAIQEITKRNTGEYAIRPFLEKYPIKTLKVLETWSHSQNKHVRRLSSEGVRPRLPWASKLQIFIEDPIPIIPILENLKDDPSKYVQKSVANCINDILKDNVEIGKNLIEKWSKNSSKERKWITKHALRNLLKSQDSWAEKIVSKSV